jgi:hypothetical protein
LITHRLTVNNFPSRHAYWMDRGRHPGNPAVGVQFDHVDAHCTAVESCNKLLEQAKRGGYRVPADDGLVGRRDSELHIVCELLRYCRGLPRVERSKETFNG